MAYIFANGRMRSRGALQWAPTLTKHDPFTTKTLLNPVPFTAQVATDDFNRADNADLGTNWTSVNDTFKIVSNAAEPRFLATDSAERYNAMLFLPDQYAQAKVTRVASGNGKGVGPAVRMSATAITYYYAVVGEDAIRVYSMVANVETQLADIFVTWVNGDVLRLEVNLTTLKVYQNGVQRGSNIENSAIAGSGYAGVAHRGGADSASLDDWVGGELGGTVIYVVPQISNLYRQRRVV